LKEKVDQDNSKEKKTNKIKEKNKESSKKKEKKNTLRVIKMEPYITH